MDKLLKFISLDKIIRYVAGTFGLTRILEVLVAINSGKGTDLLGALVNYAKGQYLQRGRNALVRMFTIKEASIQAWATAVHGSGSEAARARESVHTAFGRLTQALVGVAEALTPVARWKV